MVVEAEMGPGVCAYRFMNSFGAILELGQLFHSNQIVHFMS